MPAPLFEIFENDYLTEPEKAMLRLLHKKRIIAAVSDKRGNIIVARHSTNTTTLKKLIKEATGVSIRKR